MTLPSSGTISLNDIKAEFGATGTRSLREFFRGGAFVPDTPQNAGVPTSGTIKISDFYGASAYSSPIINLVDHVIQGSPEPNEVPPPAYLGCTVQVTFNSSGALSAFVSYGSSITPAIGGTEWLSSGSASNCELFVTVTSGTLTSGTTGSWLALTSSRTFTYTTGSGIKGEVVLNCKIRDKNTLAVLDECNITLKVA